MNWQEAFHAQAHSDWRIYEKLNQDPDAEDCHKLHYLLMASEKLAKAHLSAENNPPSTSHLTLKGFLHQCGNNPRFRSYINTKSTSAQFRSYITSMKLVADHLLSLVPTSNTTMMNVEYPWANNHGLVIAPCTHSFMGIPVNVTVWSASRKASMLPAFHASKAPRTTLHVLLRHRRSIIRRWRTPDKRGRRWRTAGHWIRNATAPRA
jgi:hypothetical protein